MEVSIEGKLKFKDDGYTEFLKLIFYYKLPDQKIKRKRKWILCRSSWDRYDNYTDFVEECKRYLSDENMLKNEVEKIILGDIQQKKNKGKRHELEELFKNYKFSFNVVIKK